jgi:hypothetical protein
VFGVASAHVAHPIADEVVGRRSPCTTVPRVPAFARRITRIILSEMTVAYVRIDAYRTKFAYRITRIALSEMTGHWLR